MGSIIVDNYRAQNAKVFVDDFAVASPNTYFLTIGRQIAWPNETLPDSAQSIPEITYSVWREMYAAKRISSGDISVGTRRYDWETGNVYDQYDSRDSAASTRESYVLTSAFRVYKVLSNNAGALSTVEPTATSGIQTTADGYRWKYMCTLTQNQVDSFLTANFMPIDISLTAPEPEGTIESYSVTSGGVGYTTATATITGDGTSATATVTLDSGVVVGIEPDDPGAGYTTASVVITGDGAGATAYPNIAPPGGHGSNFSVELFAHFAMLGVFFNFNEGGTFSIANDFRRIALISNPIEENSAEIAENATYRQTASYSVTSPTGAYIQDEQVTFDNGSFGNVVEYVASPPTIFVNNIKGALASSGTVVGGQSGSSATITSVAPPELVPFSGNLFYFDNRGVVTRAENQIEHVIVVFEY